MSTNPKEHDEFAPAEVDIHAILREAAKDEAEMDVAWIEKSIADSYPADPDGECREMLRRIRRDERKRRLTGPGMRRFAAAAACLMVFSLASLGVARAFNMDAVLNFFSALTELFSYESDSAQDGMEIEKAQDGVPVKAEAWGDVDANDVITYADAGVLLESIGVYTDGLRALFERYAFVSASVNDDGFVNSWTITIADAHATPIYIRLIVQKLDETIASYVYERDADGIGVEWVGDVSIALAENIEVCSTRWTDGKIHGNVWGNIDAADVMEITKELLGG